MGKLSDRIRGARASDGRRIGFAGPGATTPASGGLLIGAAGADRAGADLHLLPDPGTGEKIAQALKAPIAAAEGAIVGIVLAQADRAGATAAANAGAVFIVLHPETARADALLESKTDAVIQLPAVTPCEHELRAFGSLRPALLITHGVIADPFPFSALLALRSIGLITQAPLAVVITPNISTATLQTLRDAGVAVLILNAPTTEQVTALRSQIVDLPAASYRKEERDTVMVPSVQPAVDFSDEDD